MTLLMISGGLITLWVVILLVRAALYRPLSAEVYPVQRSVDSTSPDVSYEEAACHLAELVSCRTVIPKSENGGGKEDEGGYEQYKKFRSLLKKFYPLIHSNLDLELVNEHSLLYRWVGQGSEKPLVLLAHYDVVPAFKEQWQHPPFDGVIVEGVIWGRGTLDTKGTLCGICEAVEGMLIKGFKPARDIYFAFGHDEETMGAGAPGIVEILKNRDVYPELVLDEGGAIIQGVFPGVDRPIAVIGLAEKGIVDIEVVLEGSGGHSSTPGRINPLSEMSKIILRLDKNPFRSYLPGEVKEMFAVIGRHMPFTFRIIFANMWCFQPLLTTILPLLGRELNALCRSTCVFTMVEGSKASNVIPDRVRAVANLRLAAIDPLDEALKHITEQAFAASQKARKAREPLKLKVSLLHGHNASASSSTASAAYQTLKQTISESFRDTIVSPYIMLGATDSRHYCAICDNVFRFSPIRMNKEELHSIHGVDERITVEKLGGIVDFYRTLIGKF